MNDDSDITNFSDIAGDIKIDTVKRNTVKLNLSDFENIKVGLVTLG